MARVTVEDCLARIPNRFALTILASRRARALSEARGHALIDCENKDAVTALREVGADKVRFKEDVDSTMTEFIEEQRRQLRVTTGEHTFLEAASLRALEDEDEEGAEEEDEDVEELQTDPEALGKQAKGSDDDSDEDGDEESSDDDSSDDEDVPAGDDDIDAAFDDDEISEDVEEDDSDSSDDEEEED